MKRFFIVGLLLGFVTVSAQIVSPEDNNLGDAQPQAAGPGGEPQAHNSIRFTYTNGNQVKREMIYLVNRQVNPIIQDSLGIAKNDVKKEFVQSEEFSDISYYPNPVKSELFLKWKNTDAKKLQAIELYNYNGQLVHKQSNYSAVEETQINFTSYPIGVYSLLMIYTNSERKTLNIIKQ